MQPLFESAQLCFNHSTIASHPSRL